MQEKHGLCHLMISIRYTTIDDITKLWILNFLKPPLSQTLAEMHVYSMSRTELRTLGYIDYIFI